jgi:hypothetical protein
MIKIVICIKIALILVFIISIGAPLNFDAYEYSNDELIHINAIMQKKLGDKVKLYSDNKDIIIDYEGIDMFVLSYEYDGTEQKLFIYFLSENKTDSTKLIRISSISVNDWSIRQYNNLYIESGNNFLKDIEIHDVRDKAFIYTIDDIQNIEFTIAIFNVKSDGEPVEDKPLYIDTIILNF